MAFSTIQPYSGLSYGAGVNYNGIYGAGGSAADKSSAASSEQEGKTKLIGLDDGKKANGEECQTCKNRKYKDGSDEMVSFKTAQHISPESAASRVRAHEQEHVSNAYSEAASNNGKVLRASVSIHMSVCPECGRSYVSGGTTSTQIKYYNEENPYQKDLKATDYDKYAGMNMDLTA
ncbi:MAG: hypothetical protein NC092_02245 [Butyrivibrio sp.]|nr:hypothetical protein [Muribaculum sp.]MCM1551494.1 hypothetical protein [Butyrivibrio sp.]